MGIITLTATPSDRELVAGIPQYVTLTTNISSMIFYTLDGSEPTSNSEVYVDPIELPTLNPSVNLRVLATNGVDTDAQLNVIYSPDWTNARLPHAKVTIVTPASLGWCGSLGDNQKVLYRQPASYTVHQSGVADTEYDGYGSDPTIYPVWGSNEPIPIFDLMYSESDSEGKMGADIGTLPKVSVIYAPPPPEYTNANKSTFNPRAMVTFQDSRVEDENNHIINRQFYDTQNFERYAYGGFYGTTKFQEGDSAPMGSLVRYLYNEKDNTITFYYRDGLTNQWVISTEPFTRTSVANNVTNMLGRYIMPNVGHKKVFKWMLFKRTGII